MQASPIPIRSLVSLDDLTDSEITTILQHAKVPGALGPYTGRTVGLLFLTSSTRTRIGFAVAAARLGCTPIELSERRYDPHMSAPESLIATFRTLSGMVDAMVVRIPEALGPALRAASRCPVVNGGDGAGEHPTQALIDLHAIETLRGPVADLRVAICGDLTMRAATSLLMMLVRFPPRQLVLIAPDERSDSRVDLTRLGGRVSRRPILEPSDVDVLYMVGMPAHSDAGDLNAAARGPYMLTSARLGQLDTEAVVLAPLPIIDEIAPDALNDHRIRMYQQSDQAVAVRMAVLDLLLDPPKTGER